MSGIFKKWFGKDDEVQRGALTHPKDLEIGDIIKFSFLPQRELSATRFTVTEINTYDYENDNVTEFLLSGENRFQIFMSVDNDGGEEYLSISRKLTKKEVSELFDNAQIADIFSEGHSELNRQPTAPKNLETWTSDYYSEDIDCRVGFYHEGDFRNKETPIYEEESERLEYYSLTDDTDEFAIDVEIYNEGETEIYATIYLEISSISELMASNEGNGY